MGKFIIAIFVCLGICTSSFAQDDSLQVQNDSLQIDQDQMVCFLTDESTITCFVAPEGEGGQIPGENEGQQFPGDTQEDPFNDQDQGQNDETQNSDNMSREIKAKKDKKGWFRKKDKGNKEDEIMPADARQI